MLTLASGCGSWHSYKYDDQASETISVRSLWEAHRPAPASEAPADLFAALPDAQAPSPKGGGRVRGDISPAAKRQITEFHRPMWEALRGPAGQGIEQAVPGVLKSIQMLFDQGYSQTDVAMMFGMSRERIRQITARHHLKPFCTATPPRIWSWDRSEFIAIPMTNGTYRAEQSRQRYAAYRQAILSARQEVFWGLVDIPLGNGCWIWKGPKYDLGDGSVSFYGIWGGIFVHRLSFLWAHGFLPQGKRRGSYIVAHTCDIGLCVNPEHLVLMTHKQNTQDAIQKGRFKQHLREARLQSHCWRGHELVPENRYRSTGACKKCQRIRHRAYYQRLKAKVA